MLKVLKNGIEVKLQLNVLSVLEPPTGHEEDDELHHSSCSSDLGEKDHEFGKLHLFRQSQIIGIA
ncbi:hypothetical protein BVRB_4g095050 [Beta vulgaris subsp. vulgaris]|uniref:Uncharacterized protein n=1 Tax=Beta vulgaris subsp. vulgaris TaxID=3555 RepID=A0A0J8BDY6_BETVV|nr:hypothetical protein BVRB_4g095050 [Beta vulgaris subsp. vulgaris]